MDILTFIQQGIYIIEGYAIWLWNMVTGKTREVARRRQKICSECVHNKHGICEVCGCVIKAKVRVDYPLDDDGVSIDGCPERKW